MKKSFNRRHAEEILNPCDVGRYITIDDRGVWPKVERDLTMQTETELLRWRPARVFQGDPDAPEVADTPMLPFPFSARDLAAFMLEGVGALVADFYGDWDDGPDPDSLRQLDPDSKARTAVIQSYAAYREAIQTAPGMDTDAMVRCLLKHAPMVAVEPASDEPAPLTTGDIAFCFDGLRWDESEWKKPLGDKPKWLAECVAIPGQRGISETRWNPVFIGAALVQQGHATARNVRAKFQSVDILKPWFEAWKTYESDNLETP